MSPINIEVTSRGEVGEQVRKDARKKVGALQRLVNGPVLGARVVLTEERNPRIPNHGRAEAEIDLQGRIVRARATGPTVEAAVDAVTERLGRKLRRYVDVRVARRRGSAQPAARTWSPGASAPPRRPVFDRPVEERQIMRRKSFAFGPMPVEEAADALQDLDHEFFLFHDVDTGADAVLYWRDDGLLALIELPHARRGGGAGEHGPVREPSRFSSPIPVEAAVEEMNAVSHRFMFFENAATGRGNVIYRRLDGNYGLIEPV
jgi:ribosome-associated translation inhibitor RaiA